MKSVLISIRPKWVEKICKGEKTVEVRKNKPNLSTPFKCYIYMTKNGSFNDFETDKNKLSIAQFLRKQGKVIGEFVCDKIEEVYQCNSGWVQENAGLSQNEFFDYLGIPRNTHFGYDKKAYGWHISDLKIYDKPKELSEFTVCKKCVGKQFNYCGTCKGTPITRPPQSWCYVESLGE